MSFTEILQTFVNLPTEAKIGLATDAFENLQPVFEHLDPRTNGMKYVYALLGAGMIVDGKLSQAEIDFARAMLRKVGRSFTEEEIVELCRQSANMSVRIFEVVKELRSHLNLNGSNELTTFMAAFCALDDKITKEEIELIGSLL